MVSRSTKESFIGCLLSAGQMCIRDSFHIADDSVFTLDIAVPCTKDSINIFLRKRAQKLMELWICLLYTSRCV